jgi:hypothetical protein
MSSTCCRSNSDCRAVVHLCNCAVVHVFSEAGRGLRVAVQIFFQFKFFLPDPVQNDVKYQASAQPFLVFGLLTTALAVGSTNSL